MKKKDVVYPDERGELGPYSLICDNCGNTEVFIYEEIVRTVIRIIDGKFFFDFGNVVKKHSKKDMISTIVSKHMSTGAGISRELKIISDNVCCGKCSSSMILLYGDVLSNCQENACPGCLMCGGAYNKENIMDTCIKCVQYRKELAKDPSIFMITLDMDLFCDACPLERIRTDYGFGGEEIRAKAGGKLK